MGDRVWLDLVTDDATGAVYQVIGHDETEAPLQFNLATPSGQWYRFTVWPHERERVWYYPLGLPVTVTEVRYGAGT